MLRLQLPADLKHDALSEFAFIFVLKDVCFWVKRSDRIIKHARREDFHAWMVGLDSAYCLRKGVEQKCANSPITKKLPSGSAQALDEAGQPLRELLSSPSKVVHDSEQGIVVNIVAQPVYALVRRIDLPRSQSLRKFARRAASAFGRTIDIGYAEV
jgi:hypothetical protein